MSELSISIPRVEVKKLSLHRLLVTLAIIAASLLVLAVVVYGLDYYWLSMAERPFSPKHSLLKPSGRIGIALGLLGFSLFLVIFLYPLRKRISWLAKRGSAKHWLDFHVICGTLAPFIIMFHASFKFQGVAGMAFWSMVVVALSGIVGRYVYAQIPRTLHSTEISLKELEAMEAALSQEVSSKQVFAAEDLQLLLRIPSAEQVRKMPALVAILKMLAIDLARPFRVARLRSHALHGTRKIRSLGGLLPSGNLELEAAIAAARRRSSLSKRVAFLAKTQQVFHLWHVIHRPFSYSFAVLAIIHLVVVISLGYL